jgi:hypothetical protein
LILEHRVFDVRYDLEDLSKIWLYDKDKFVGFAERVHETVIGDFKNLNASQKHIDEVKALREKTLKGKVGDFETIELLGKYAPKSLKEASESAFLNESAAETPKNALDTGGGAFDADLNNDIDKDFEENSDDYMLSQM